MWSWQREGSCRTLTVRDGGIHVSSTLTQGLFQGYRQYNQFWNRPMLKHRSAERLTWLLPEILLFTMETRAKDYRAEESCEGKRKMYFRVRYGLCNARTIVQSMLQYEYVEAESYPQHEVGDYIMFL